MAVSSSMASSRQPSSLSPTRNKRICASESALAGKIARKRSSARRSIPMSWKGGSAALGDGLGRAGGGVAVGTAVGAMAGAVVRAMNCVSRSSSWVRSLRKGCKSSAGRSCKTCSMIVRRCSTVSISAS
ncbi:MAG: hypothetical protein LBU43_03160 [Candidatus Accumulibacter sp.]|nr:hypothetical protein [Accumulibacter sp.]